MADRAQPNKEASVIFPPKHSGETIQNIKPTQTVDTATTTKKITNKVTVSKGYLYNVQLTADIKDIY